MTSAIKELLVNETNFSRQTWCLTSTETIRLIRDGEEGGVGGGVIEV